MTRYVFYLGFVLIVALPAQAQQKCAPGEKCAIEKVASVVRTIDGSKIERVGEVLSDVTAQFHEDRAIEAARKAVGDDAIRVTVDIVLTAQEIETLIDGIEHFLTNTPRGRELYLDVFGDVFAGGAVNVNSADVEEAVEKIVAGYRAFNRARRGVRERFPELAKLERLDVRVWYNQPAFARELRCMLKRLTDRYFLNHYGGRPYRSGIRRRQVRRSGSIYNRRVWGELNALDTRALIVGIDGRADRFLERAEADHEPNRTINFKPVKGDLHNHHNGFVAIQINGEQILTVSSPKKGMVSGPDLVRGLQSLVATVRDLRDAAGSRK